MYIFHTKQKKKNNNTLQRNNFKYLSLSDFFFGRFRVQHEALQKVESEQNEFIEQFILQK